MEYFRFNPDQYLNIPEEPGVYKYFNKEGKIIYVGKAKNLKKRVSSYFSRTNQHNRKTQRLVHEIRFIEITIVNSEMDALLLENGLIKENQPKYNILLKDDKSFPSILITNDHFPKIYSTRKIDSSLGEYYGPYTSVKGMKSLLELVRKLYKIRTCNLALTQENISKNKFKVCLEYHIGNCKGPCEGLQSLDDYQSEIDHARQIIKGNVNKIKSIYKEQMQDAAAALNFESAQQIKDQLELLEKFQSKSAIVNPKVSNTDVITIIQDVGSCYVNYLKIDEGAIIVSDTFEVKIRMDESIEEIIDYVLPSMQTKFNSTSTNILSNYQVTLWNGIETSLPIIGDKKTLVDLSIKNALYLKREKEEQKRLKTDQSNRILETLQKDLRLKALPKHIECFDNSNIQGSDPVASMVCFKNGKPSKKDYRKFNIKTIIGPDDFGSMKEIVFRRYKRLIEEEQSLPDLIVIDGGKGQLNAATESLKQLDIYSQVPIIGIAKRLEEIYYPEDQYPLLISKKSESLKILQHLRDEAHRFAITFHRDKRSKSAITSELDNIKGIGDLSKKQLLIAFGSVKRIQSGSLKQLTEVIGEAKAVIVFNYFNEKRG